LLKLVRKGANTHAWHNSSKMQRKCCLCSQTPHYKDVWGSGGITPYILDLVTRGEWCSSYPWYNSNISGPAWNETIIL